MNTEYSINIPDVEINYLIYHSDDPTSGEFKVYVDKDLDLDWECDDTMGKLIDAMPLKASVRKILNGVASLEPIAHNWPNDLKLASKRLLGEAVVSVFQGDVEGSEKALSDAKAFFRSKSRQVSRYWTLRACLIAGGIAALLGLLEAITRTHLIGFLGMTVYLLSLCFCAGCVGALLFVVMRLGKQPKVDSTAERHLHYLEGISRIIGGGIGGVLVGGAVKMGLILPVFGQSGAESLAMCVAAMIAGASERLAAGIVTKVESDQTNEQENENGNN
jgi:hypothetical protein